MKHHCCKHTSSTIPFSTAGRLQSLIRVTTAGRMKSLIPVSRHCSRSLGSMSRLDSIQDSRLLHRIVSLLLGSRVLLFLHVYWLSWKCYHGCELRCRCTHQWSTFPSILLGRTLSPWQQTPSPCQQTIGTTGRQEETRNWRANYPVVIITWRKFSIFQNFKVKKLLLDRVYYYCYWSRTISI